MVTYLGVPMKSNHANHDHDKIAGFHSVLTALEHKQPISEIYIAASRQDKRFQALINLANEQHIPIHTVDKAKLDSWSTANHQGVIAVLTHQQNMPTDVHDLLDSLTVPPFLLILDGVQDPHNLGACLRSAAAANVHGVIIPKDNAVGLTPVVRKVACGGAEIVPLIQVTNLARTIGMLKERGIWIYGLTGNVDTRLYDADLTGAIALVLGAEEKGLRRLTMDSCDGLFAIPLPGPIPSLNVSVATGITLFEAVRQRSVGCGYQSVDGL